MPERTVLCLDTLFVQGDDKKRYKNGEKENVSFICLNFWHNNFFGDDVKNILNKMVFSISKCPSPFLTPDCVPISNCYYEVGICKL